MKDRNSPDEVQARRQAKSKKPAEATVEQWAELYEIAGNIKLLAPWDYLWDSDLITIMLPGEEEPICCSIMGRNGECYAIGVYPGFEAIMSYYRLARTTEELPQFLAGLEQKCLACHFGDREEVSDKDRETYKALGLKFRGRNEWIYFRSMEPGLYPWHLDSKQVDLMIQALGNLAMACMHLQEGKITVDFGGGQTLFRHYSPEKGLWLNMAAQMPPIPVKMTNLSVKDELLIASLRKAKQTKQRLEYDMAYLPFPVQERKQDRPYLPRSLLLVDSDSALILDQHMAEPDEDFIGNALRMLATHIEEHGRPAAVHVRDERMSCLIEDLCKKIGVKLIVGKGMPTMDAILSEIIELMGEKSM